MELTKDTRDRIFAAADALFEQNGRDAFPTVDAVRKAARVNMNDASSGMKEWRRVQTAQAAPVAVQVPEAVQAAGGQAVAVLWQQAQELANESLRAAQAGWEGERAELDTVRIELADAYESQAIELEAAQEQIKEQIRELATAGALAQAQDKTLAELREALALSERRAALAEQKGEETEHRARELRAELDRAHQEADRLRQERDQAVGQVKAVEAERDNSREEATKAREETLSVLGQLAEVKAKAAAEGDAHHEQRKMAAQEAARQAERYTKAQAERDNSREEATKAREEAATLRGRLEALETVMAKAEKTERGGSKSEKY